MKPLLLTIISCLLISSFLFSQVDKESLMNEAQTKIRSGSLNNAALLADKRYDVVHPETRFRDLVKENAKAETLVITNSDEPGRKIEVKAVVKDNDGKPVPGALVYLYQTDSKGWYSADAPHVNMNEGDMRHARIFGYVRTDTNGEFILHTVKPSGYPQSDLPAHIHVHVWADGYSNFVNEFLFDDDERLVGNIREQSVRNRFIISKPEKAKAPFEQLFSYTITLQKK